MPGLSKLIHSRDAKLLSVVEDLLAHKDDKELDGELQQATISCTLVPPQSSPAHIVTRSASDGGTEGEREGGRERKEREEYQ